MNPDHPNQPLTSAEREALLGVLQARFEKNKRRHAGLEWAAVRARLEANPARLATLGEMERTGGEPDVVGCDQATGAYIFCDCSPESPDARRSLCYDRAALDARKENKPETSAMEMAAAMGVELLTEAQYRALQALGEFDLKTSSWLTTPAAGSPALAAGVRISGQATSSRLAAALTAFDDLRALPRRLRPGPISGTDRRVASMPAPRSAK